MLPVASDSSSLSAEQDATDPNHTSSSGMGIPIEDGRKTSPSSAGSSARGDHAGHRASSPLSDIPAHHDGSVMKEALDLSGDNESSASDFDAPVNKKAKSNKGKATTQAKKTLKKSRKSNKGKGKARQLSNSDEASDSELPVKAKQLIAKRSEWRDIPDWTDDRCPIFSLGVELLDRCFDVTRGLEPSDYLALAGVSRFFRHNLNEEFFYALLLWEGSHGVDFPKRQAHILARPFSRTIKDVYTPMPLQSLADYGLPRHYRPRGPRSQWTKSQYTVYKEEKEHCLTKTRRRREMDAELKELHAERQEHEVDFVEYGHGGIDVLATVPGRLPGESAVRKDSRGFPILHPAYDLDLLSIYGDDLQSDSDTSYCDDSTNVSSDTEAVEAIVPRSMDIQSNDVDWAVPDTDQEETDSDLLPKVVYTFAGEKICHDFWPSNSRKIAAKGVRRKRLTKSVAVSTFKVTEAELITLKHYLIPNLRTPKNSRQLFSRAAVRALAFRSHGGPAGHRAHLARLEARASKARETRRKNGAIIKRKKGCWCPMLSQDYTCRCGEHSDWSYFSVDSEFYDL